MRKIAIIVGLAVTSAAFAQTSGKELLDEFAKNLNSAKSLSATYTLQPIGGVPATYNMQLSKPNLARFETPRLIVVADGKNITTYTKADKTYSKEPQTNENLQGLFADDDASLWLAFFNGDALSGARMVKNLGPKTRQGVDYTKIQATMDPGGHKTAVFYIDKDKIARQAEITQTDDKGTYTLLISASAVNLGAEPIEAEKLAFVAPAGSHELTAEELNSNKWFEDIEEAKKMAARTHRLVMVDFYAVW